MHIARRCGAKVILHIHGARFDAFCSHASKFQQAIIRQSLESADRVIVLSQHWQQLLSPFAPQARFQVVPNGVAIEPQAKDIRAATEYRAATTEGDQGGSLKERSSGPPAPARERSPAPPPPCRFLFLAAICARKGIDVLIEAASRLASRNIPQHLTIAGPEETPGEADWLRNAIRTARIEHSVSFVGPITGQAKADLLAESDCLVLPSRAEGLPLTLLEAGASSLPVIATTVGAIPEVIYSRELGILVPPADAAALAAAMTDLAADRPKRHRLGANLHQRVATTYSLERQSGLLAAIYRDLNQPRFVSVPLTRALLAGVDL
jgi:glycosyltransferase involved in cell wall biosynthesis